MHLLVYLIRVTNNNSFAVCSKRYGENPKRLFSVNKFAYLLKAEKVSQGFIYYNGALCNSRLPNSRVKRF